MKNHQTKLNTQIVKMDNIDNKTKGTRNNKDPKISKSHQHKNRNNKRSKETKECLPERVADKEHTKLVSLSCFQIV